MKFITFFNQKGGVGKSTSVFIVGGELAIMKKKRVLIIDGDEQRHASKSFLLGDEKYIYSPVKCNTVYNLVNGTDIRNCIRSVTYQKKGLFGAIAGEYTIDVLPACPGQNDIKVDDYYFLKKAVAEIEEDYDYIIADMPPGLTDIAVSILTATDYVLVPAEAGLYPIMGYGDLVDTINTVRENLNSKIMILGVFITRINEQANFHKYIASQFEGNLMKTCISNSIIAQECVGDSPLCIYQPSAKVTKQYRALTNEILELIDMYEN